MNTDRYKILKNETFGRYMVANRNIKAGELIISENPTLLGPQIDGPPICFSCCRNVRRTGFILCKTCDTAIICSSTCPGNFHTPEECSILKELKVDGNTLEKYDQALFPLRCLLIKRYKPDIWKIILELEPHMEQRRDTIIWRRHRTLVEQVLRKLNLLSNEELEDELVQKICGILDVNTFEVRPPQSNSLNIANPEVQCLRGLYLNAALMAHDCNGNTLLSVDDNFVLTVKASVDIPENFPIFFNYSNVLHGSVDRKQHLREGKYFECCCTRCKDPTELGTDISSLKCHFCRKGNIRMKDTENIKSAWACSECKRELTYHLVNTTVEEGRRRIQEIDQTDIIGMEALLRKLLQTFHCNHYLLLELKQNMIGLYVRLPPNKKNLSRKITLCQEILDVVSKIEPGISRIRAITLYQLQSSMIDLAHMNYKDKELKRDDLILQLLAAEIKLKEGIKHLLYEPQNSPEGKITQMALSELKMLRTSINNIQNTILRESNPKNKLSKKVIHGAEPENQDQKHKESKENGIPEVSKTTSTKSKTRRNKKKK